MTTPPSPAPLDVTDDSLVWRGVDVLMRDGAVARIRPLRPDDADAVRRLHEGVSEDNLRRRFFSASRRSAEVYAEHLLRFDARTTCLAAVVGGQVVGVASAEDLGDATSEVALLLADDQHGRGLGTLLLEHLADSAREQGARRFVAEVLDDNLPMRHVFEDLGSAYRTVLDDGVVQLSIDLTPVTTSLDSADQRDEEAERRSLEPLLHPGSVVLLGVRRDGSGVGAALLRSIRSGGFSGRLELVHPGGGSVLGVPAVASCSELARPADLAVIAVPAVHVVDALRDVAEAGTHAAVVVSSGFGELGDRGARLQAELIEVARTHSVRLVGPNCLGLVTHADGSVLNATFADMQAPDGGVAVASQSGGVGIVVLDAARRSGLGIGTFVSLGNKADVSGNDLLAAWREDPTVSTVCLYLESFGNGHRFARLARRFSRTKPVLAVVGGRSEGGRRAGASHTAAAASPAVAVDALLRHTGVIACRGATDMVATASLLEQQPLPTGPRVAIVTNAGGMGVLAADSAGGLGLEVPRLSDSMARELASALSASAGWSNPVDTGAGATAEQLVEAVRLVSTSDEVDSVLVVLVATTMTDVQDVVRRLGLMRDQHPGVPGALVVLGAGSMEATRAAGLTVFADPDLALEALARCGRRAAWLTANSEEPAPVDLVRQADVRRRAREVATTSGSGWADFTETRDLLGRYGLPLMGRAAHGAVGAVEAAHRVGYPVVLKLATPGAHKTEGGFVAVGIRHATGVRRVCADWAHRTGRPVDVLVQPRVQGVEVAVGLVRDPVVGPLVMLAAGGIDVDVWDDRVFLLAPVTGREVEEALRGLKVWPKLQGYRGSAPTAVAALVDVVTRVGQLAEEVPEVAELDLNPVIVTEEEALLVDSRLRLRPAVAFRDAPALR